MNKFIQENTARSKKIKDITFHYTNELLVKDLIRLTPIQPEHSVLDAGSGKNKVWFNNLSPGQKKYECEIEDGVDFLTDWNTTVDWVIGNPPFADGWKFLEKAACCARVGVAFLGNINFFNCLTPKRLYRLAELGFFLNRIHIVMDKRWFGRYYYVIFARQSNSTITWNEEMYK